MHKATLAQKDRLSNIFAELERYGWDHGDVARAGRAVGSVLDIEATIKHFEALLAEDRSYYTNNVVTKLRNDGKADLISPWPINKRRGRDRPSSGLRSPRS